MRPVRYPVSCSPQAWASGAFFMVLQGTLGLFPAASEGVLHVRTPALPDFLRELHHHPPSDRRVFDLAAVPPASRPDLGQSAGGRGRSTAGSDQSVGGRCNSSKRVFQCPRHAAPPPLRLRARHGISFHEAHMTEIPSRTASPMRAIPVGRAGPSGHRLSAVFREHQGVVVFGAGAGQARFACPR